MRRRLIHAFDGAGVVQGMHNTDASIRSFAHSCFRYAAENGIPMIFSTKDTISKQYDGRFKKIFEEVYEEYRAQFEAKGIWVSLYPHRRRRGARGAQRRRAPSGHARTTTATS